VLGLGLALALAGAGTAAAETRYSLQGGCYSASGLAGAEQVRMQATDLGSYLLYRPDRSFVALVDGAPGVAAEPSPAADWTVAESTGDSFTLAPKSDSSKQFTVSFTPASGCAVFPEAGLDATGRPRANPTAYGSVKGVVEGHMHWMTYLYFGGNFHCGAPWHPYGIVSALPDCSGIEGPQGVNAPFQNTLNYGNPAQPHDTSGYPTLGAWSPDNLTYEGTYWRWIERAWLSGLRVMVMGVNENRVLCLLQTNRTRSCNEMTTMRDAIKSMYRMQDYIDAQAGGPGKGFMRIVRNPFEARRAVNQGKMAVLLEIELSEPFDCSNLENPTCDRASVDKQLDEMYKLGVRSSLLVGKFDNPLTGVRFDDGTTGVLINGGNKISAGSFFSARTCTGKLHDNEIFAGSPEVSAGVASLFGAAGLQPGTAPVYPPAPHCNTRGLTTLGGHVVRRMMDKHMIVNPDHMSQAGVDETLTILETRRYSGVISPHGWMDPGNWPRIWKLGGIAFPGHSSAASYIKDWEDYRPRSTPFKFGWGYGADLGGLSHQPKVADAKGTISYPFKGLDGQVTFGKQKTGERTFDYTKDGVSQYGLYADWFADLRRLGGKPMVRDMLAGAEAYIEMWERASGVPQTSCFSRGGALTAAGRGPLAIGASWKRTLRRAGQPQQRTRAWSWCVKGPRNAGKADVAVLGRTGRVALVGSTARRFAGPFRVGNRARFHGIRRRGTFVAAASHGKIRAVGVSSLRGKPLTRAMIRVLRAKATQKRPRYVPGKVESQRSSGLAGITLAGSRDAELNAKLALFCRLQMS
jgi:hypothetical protein